jgi:hypothetical protein
LSPNARRVKRTRFGHYEQALTHKLAPDLRPIIERHRLAVQEALLELGSLEQVRRAG